MIFTKVHNFKKRDNLYQKNTRVSSFLLMKANMNFQNYHARFLRYGMHDDWTHVRMDGGTTQKQHAPSTSSRLEALKGDGQFSEGIGQPCQCHTY